MNPDQNQDQAPQGPAPTPETTPYQAPTVEQPAQPVEPVAEPQPQAVFGALDQSQPQPQAQPEATPVQPVGAPAPAPVPTPLGAPAAPTPGGGKDKKKLAILLGAIGGGIILIGLVLVAVWFLLFNVSAADYEEARTQLTELRSDFSGISANSIGSGTSDGEEVLASFNAFKEKHEALSGLKAFRGDSELRDLYTEYDAKADEYIKFMDAVLPSAIRFSEVTAEMRSIGSSDAEGFRTIAESFRTAASEISDADIKSVAEDLAGTFDSVAGHYETLTDSSASTSERIAASSEARKEINNFQTRVREFSDDFETRYEAVNPTDAFNALSDATTTKANESN